jgi:NAD(P)-dependent dehydrogenase (short-subunit alcohol dehydrogenase family)
VRVICARRTVTGEAAAARARAAHPLQGGVRRTRSRVVREHPPVAEELVADKVDALICNAGLALTARTDEGLERTVGVCHRSFLLARLLMPRLLHPRAARGDGVEHQPSHAGEARLITSMTRFHQGSRRVRPGEAATC